MTWFPLADLASCEVMGDLHYRHIMLYIYATKSDYMNYNLRYKETASIMINTFCIKWFGLNDEPYFVTGNVFFKVFLTCIINFLSFRENITN